MPESSRMPARIFYRLPLAPASVSTSSAGPFFFSSTALVQHHVLLYMRNMMMDIYLKKEDS